MIRLTPTGMNEMRGQGECTAPHLPRLGAGLVSCVCVALWAAACTQGSGAPAPADENDADAPGAELSEAPAYEGVEIIAHRGDSWHAPENTMASVTSAWAKNTDAVEIDVYLTKDNRVVALHDRTTGRTGDIELHVNESTSEELRRVDVGSWKDEAFAGEPIPLLEDIVASIPRGKRLFIEIKGTAETVPYISEIVEASGTRDQVAVIGFELDTVKASKAAMPDIPTYWLVSAPRDDEDNPQPIPVVAAATAKQNGLDGLNVNHQGISKELVDECRRLGLGIFVWTVNEVPDLTAMAHLGVDGITTDRIDNTQGVLR